MAYLLSLVAFSLVSPELDWPQLEILIFINACECCIVLEKSRTRNPCLHDEHKLSSQTPQTMYNLDQQKCMFSNQIDSQGGASQCHNHVSVVASYHVPMWRPASIGTGGRRIAGGVCDEQPRTANLMGRLPQATAAQHPKDQVIYRITLSKDISTRFNLKALRNAVRQ